MSQVQFKVSARTARLIGRENIASSKGAIIELVKNGYDADSPVSIVYFDNKFSLEREITSELFHEFISKGLQEDELLALYSKNDEDNSYTLKDEVSDDLKTFTKGKLQQLNSLYIIDIGEGMTQNVIRDHWMTIGTDNKAQNIFAKSGRVKAGAKGIGRFALDKLGSKCEMITVFDPEKHKPDTNEDGNLTDNTGYVWRVDWERFEANVRTIDEVTADLDGFIGGTIKERILEKLPDFDFDKLGVETEIKYGTLLHIHGLRDDWEDYFVEEVFSDLEVLVPPKEIGEFKVFLFSSLHDQKYGQILGSVCDDYDYRIDAKADSNQNIEITITRKEYDLETVDPNLFKRQTFQEYPYTRETFVEGFWKTERTFSKLVPGFAQIDDKKVLENIGPFEFTFYFMKRTFSSPDLEKFFYRRFKSNDRKDWLNKYGGVKLFRDNFRVRPYGEINNSAFDWLGLGARKSKSPAAVSKLEGGYVVEPDNVAGAITISRIANVNFDDKSSREGLLENDEFQVFKNIIIGIISIFEEDRAKVASEMLQFFNDKYSERINEQEAERLAEAIREQKEKEEQQEGESQIDKEGEGSSETENNQTSESDASQQAKQKLYILAELNKKKNERIEKLEDEQKVLRGLASSGIVLASFSHDLSKLDNVLDSRVDKLKTLIASKIEESEYEGIEERRNPFSQLEKMRKQDVKLKNWLNFSLGSARKDKRTRKQLEFLSYFKDYKIDWSSVLENRAIEFDISSVGSSTMRVFEIDIDSIFNNLLINSIDAFSISKVNRSRKVTIKVYDTSKETILEYYDSGPGLSPDIEKPELIFEPLFTTKRNAHTGEEEGTGLGMWIVKSIVDDNDGQVNLLYPEYGFGIRMIFPLKFK